MGIISYLLAKGSRIARGVAIRDSVIDGTSKVHSGSVVANTRIARYSYCGYDCMLFNCEVGPFCSFSSRVNIGGVAHPAHFVSTSPVFLSHKDSIKTKFARHDYLPLLHTEIGADVWIGEGAFIKAGVHIGHGSIIGMGAVVTRDVSPYAVVAGNPARLIRYRFDADVISGLLASRWWDWSESRLREMGPYMNDPGAFLGKVTSS